MTLYRIAAYEGAATWTPITPAGSYEPDFPYGLSVDVITPNKLWMVADNGTNQHLFTSDNQGTNWTDGGETDHDYRGIKVVGDLVVAFGVDAIVFSEDGGATVSSRIGDWESAIGPVATFRGVWVAIE